jgi:hypothetical protein
VAGGEFGGVTLIELDLGSRSTRLDCRHVEQLHASERPDSRAEGGAFRLAFARTSEGLPIGYQ